jgi:hypothetical protein
VLGAEFILSPNGETEGVLLEEQGAEYILAYGEPGEGAGEGLAKKFDIFSREK